MDLLGQSITSGEISLIVILMYIGFKVLMFAFDLIRQAGNNQNQIVQTAGDNARRGDDLLNKVLGILTNTLAKLTNNELQQTRILDEIKSVTKDTNTRVVTLPVTMEQRFDLLERQLALSDRRNKQMWKWMINNMGLTY